MQYRKLGSSDLEVSEISLGSWLTYGVGVEADKARACLDAAFDQGINFIDTANIYGKGAAERFLGEALKGRPRDSYILATKLFFPMTDQDRGLSAAQVGKQLDASLERLQTDHVDRRPDLVRGPFGKTDIARLAAVDRACQRLHRFLERRLLVVAVALVEIDVIGLQPLQ